MNLKISFVLLILLGLATIVTAQTEKGNFLISASGSLDFASLSLKLANGNISKDAGKVSTVEFTPGAAYFIANMLLVWQYLSHRTYRLISALDMVGQLRKLKTVIM